LTPANRFVIPDNRTKLLGARLVGGSKTFSQTIHLPVFFPVPRVKLSPDGQKSVDEFGGNDALAAPADETIPGELGESGLLIQTTGGKTAAR
jgi:hypothetical protein